MDEKKDKVNEEEIRFLKEILKGEKEKGVFDEDITQEGDGEIFDEDLAEEAGEDVSDFSIADTILSTATTVPDWDGQNLEESVGKEKIQRDWTESDEFVGTDIYNIGSNNGSFYTAGQSVGDLYQTGESGQDLYKDSKSGNLYNTGNDGQQERKNLGYVEQGHTRSYGEIEDNRRTSGRSMLEVAGFEDKEKQKTREMRERIRYEGNN